ncbi:hypothetical protein [Nostoc sp. 'Peltigera membranacea cyanobiont' 213]|uniref:hypothetical protein n=1 Tax=Nostoc sp. 'Peltigera membranacea cyanobiont' 213 TaxID=2014530 RepID=UPI00167EB3B8|nr:hypothetical protein [Nostoc sp. 'Peltigera membranacea cyanobiont' 213]
MQKHSPQLQITLASIRSLLASVFDTRKGRRERHYELRITNYELRITNYELRITNYELRH